MKITLRKPSGFTLIELLVVIAIIGLLSTLAIVSLSSAREKARDTKRSADLRIIQSAVELYISDQGTPPAIGGGSTWTTLGNDLTNYIVSGALPVPPGTGNECDMTGNPADPLTMDCFVYCQDSASSKYLLGALHEDDTNDINGDLDGNISASYGANECVTNDGLMTSDADFSCDDPRLCLGEL